MKRRDAEMDGPGPRRWLAALVLGAALAGCASTTSEMVRYEIDAPGMKSQLRSGFCGLGAKLVDRVETEFEGAQIAVEALEAQDKLTVRLMVSLKPDSVAEFKQTQLALTAPGLSAPLPLNAIEIAHYERKLGNKTACVRPKASNPLLPPPEPVCEPAYSAVVFKSQPIDQVLVPAPAGPTQTAFPVVYFVSYVSAGGTPEEFSVTTPRIEINHLPLPQTTMRFRRKAEMITVGFSC